MTTNSKRNQDSMDTTDATPAPQGEKCAHAPDALDALALELYGRKAKPREFIGGSDATILRDAANALARERESRKQAEAALRDVKSLVDSQIAYLQALAKNNDLSDHGTGKLAAFMNMRDVQSKPVQEPAERESGK